MVQPFIQNLNGWSEDNRRVIENDVLLPCAMRMLELSNTDISSTLAESLSTQIAKNMLAGMQQQMDAQQQQIDGMQAQMDAQQQPAEQGQAPDVFAQAPEEQTMPDQPVGENEVPELPEGSAASDEDLYQSLLAI